MPRAFSPISHTNSTLPQSIDQLELEIKQRVGTPKEKKYAKALLPILNRRHLLLVTLLLFNASAAESLPLFLGARVRLSVAICTVDTRPFYLPPIKPDQESTPSLNHQRTRQQTRWCRSMWPSSYRSQPFCSPGRSYQALSCQARAGGGSERIDTMLVC